MSFKKIFFAFVLVVVAATGIVACISLVKEETLLNLLEKSLGPIATVALGVLWQMGQAAVRKDIFGGWAIEIKLDEEILEDEKENLSVAYAEKMLRYERARWLVYFFGGEPVLRDDLEVENLLRDYCKSQGEVAGDVKRYVSIYMDNETSERLVVINLASDKLKKHIICE